MIRQAAKQDRGADSLHFNVVGTHTVLNLFESPLLPMNTITVSS